MPSPNARGESWSDEENELVVADYFAMLASEIRGEPYNKAAHNEGLRRLLRGRSKGSVERKHQNISALLLRARLPFIDGYKPLRNAQQSLQLAIEKHLMAHPEFFELFDRVASRLPSAGELSLALTSDREVAKPSPLKRENVVADRRPPLRLKAPDYAELDRANRQLGLLGEEFVVEQEQRKLTNLGRRDLASQVVHVAKVEGDGLGYDVRSFSASGKTRLIEVKTTNHGSRFPFLITRNEVDVSARESRAFHLYRVFSFSRDPRFFVLPGPVAESCAIEPRVFLAKVI